MSVPGQFSHSFWSIVKMNQQADPFYTASRSKSLTSSRLLWKCKLSLSPLGNFPKTQVKGNVVPVHFMKAYRGCEVIATLILNHCTRCSLDPNQENSEYRIRSSVVLNIFVHISNLTVQNFLDSGRLTEWEVFNDALNYQTSWKTAKWTRCKYHLKTALVQIYVILNVQ